MAVTLAAGEVTGQVNFDSHTSDVVTDAVRLINDFNKPPVVYNWSLGVQRDIGFNLVADFAYVGNAARNQLISGRQINGQPYGYAYQAANLDPTNVSGGQAQPYLEDLLRP